MDAVIRTENLTKRYGSNRGIEGVSLTVEQGEVFGFLGPNGAGKTTTIRTLLNFLRPTAGRACIFGLDTQRESVAIHARLGNLPGEFSFDEKMTGRELIRLFAQAVDPAPFARIPGVGDLHAEGTSITLHASDSMDPIVKLAAQHTLVDLSVERPSLEEIFLTYYGDHP